VLVRHGPDTQSQERRDHSPGGFSRRHVQLRRSPVDERGTSFSAAETGLHVDVHAIVFAPSDTTIVYTGNDGGIWRSTNGGVAWTNLNNSGFSATQFQSIALHPTDPNFSIGGTQDNGTNMYTPLQAWNRIDFGDGGYAEIDQNAANVTNVTMYHTYFNQSANLLAFDA